MTPRTPLRAFNHPLGESSLTFYATRSKAKRLARDFPRSLHGTPILLPGEKSTQRINLLSWFDRLGIAPTIVADFDDSALMKYFGQAGYGVFCTPSITARHVEQQYGVSVIGHTDEIVERFYLISSERKVRHPVVRQLMDSARDLFKSSST